MNVGRYLGKGEYKWFNGITSVNNTYLVAEGLTPWQSCVKGAYTLVTLPRIVTPYRDSVDGTRDRVTYQKLVTR
jgi:hypothetical protein